MAAGSKEVIPTARSATAQTGLPRFFYRLSAHAQQGYLRSNLIDHFDLMAGPALFERLALLNDALGIGMPPAVLRAAQSLVAEICRLLRIKSVSLTVRGVRPRSTQSELHGLFYPHAPAPAARAAGIDVGQPLIVLWMRTAQRHEIVKPRTFLRTLMHELGHYLDYALLKLDDSYHSTGFFKRESFLVRLLTPPAIPPATRTARTSPIEPSGQILLTPLMRVRERPSRK